MKLIDKDALVAEIEKLLDKGKYHDEYDCAFRDGNNNALYALKDKLDTLEVKEVDLEKEIDNYIYTNNGRQRLALELDWKHCDLTLKGGDAIIKIAKHFFELGLKKRQKNIWHFMNETPNYPCDILFLTDIDNMVLYRYMENGSPVNRETPYFGNILNGKCWCYCDDVKAQKGE